MKTGKFIAIFFLAAASVTSVKAQDTIRQVNGQFTVELRRDSMENLTAVVSLNDPSKCSAIIIEKGRWSTGEFRQCANFDVKNAMASISIFEIKIDYPLSPLYDSYYRVKLVGTDGNEVVFPAMLMPAKQCLLPKHILM